MQQLEFALTFRRVRPCRDQAGHLQGSLAVDDPAEPDAQRRNEGRDRGEQEHWRHGKLDDVRDARDMVFHPVKPLRTRNVLSESARARPSTAQRFPP
jgi:hypothetical protein